MSLSEDDPAVIAARALVRAMDAKVDAMPALAKAKPRVVPRTQRELDECEAHASLVQIFDELHLRRRVTKREIARLFNDVDIHTLVDIWEGNRPLPRWTWPCVMREWPDLAARFTAHWHGASFGRTG